MSKRKVVNSSAEIPYGMTEAEVHEFWSTHSVGPGLLAEPLPDDGFVDPPTRPVRSRAISLRLGTDLDARIQRLAERKGTPYQTLMKEFLLERTYEEEKRLGLVGNPEAA